MSRSNGTAGVDDAAFESFVELLRGRSIVALAGAGCSTESGIPDYRGPEGSLRGRKPIQYQEFVRSEATRARYWARSAVGWPRIARARPNSGHEGLARLEASGPLLGVITQNVDGLHQKAGSRRVIELHGSLGWVCCLDCGARVTRGGYQERLLEANPGWVEEMLPEREAAEAAPDGDAELGDDAYRSFRVPPCDECGGVLKPDVVFFGENVPAARVEEAWRLFDEAEVLLVVGSSLTVYSGRRFIYRAQQEKRPIAVINLGPTRADEAAAAKLEGRLGEVLPRLTAALADPIAPRAVSATR